MKKRKKLKVSICLQIKRYEVKKLKQNTITDELDILKRLVCYLLFVVKLFRQDSSRCSKLLTYHFVVFPLFEKISTNNFIFHSDTMFEELS